MLGQLVAAQFDLENAIADLMRSGSSASLAQSQLQALTQLQRQIGAADAAGLATLQNSVASVIAQAQTIAQQGQGAANESELGDAASREAANRTVSEVARDYYEKRVLDPYLRFASPEDEAEYRERERQNKEAIEREKAKGTPEGDRNAAAILKRQILDAGAHGADASPDYAPMLKRVSEADAALREPERQSGGKTSPEATPPRAPPATQTNGSQMDDVLAALQAAGVTTTEQPGNSGHGLADATRPVRTAGTEVRQV